MTDLVSIWWSSPDRTDEADAFPDAIERKRLRRLTNPGDRARFITSRLMLKSLITQATGVPAGEVRLSYECDQCGEPHGKPTVAFPVPPTPVHVSLAHSGERVVAALTEAGPVGVDVELISEVDFPGFDATVLTSAEARDLAEVPEEGRHRVRASLWSRKEAVLKATGHGLTVDPRLVDVSVDRDQLSVVLLPGYETTFVQFFDLPLGPPFRGAVAVIAAGPLDVELTELLPPEHDLAELGYRRDR